MLFCCVFAVVFKHLELGSLVIPILALGSPVSVPLVGGFTVLEGCAVLSPLAVTVVDFTPCEVALLDDIFVLSEGTLDAVTVVSLGLLEEAGEGFGGSELVEDIRGGVDLSHFVLILFLSFKLFFFKRLKETLFTFCFSKIFGDQLHREQHRLDTSFLHKILS